MEHYLKRLEDTIKQNWDKPGLSNYKGETFTFGNIAIQIEKLHILFKNNGIKKGDKIALCSKNNAHWCMAFFAITSYGAVVVPILNEFLPESVTHLTDHSDSVLIFTEKGIWEKMDPEKMPHLNGAINIETYTSLYSRDNILTNSITKLDILYKEKYPNGIQPDDLHYCIDNMDELTLISYTSGTTSSPKGVMLNALCLSSNREFAVWGVPNKPGEKIVSMLPLAHMYGLAFELIYPLSSGCHVYLLGKTPTPTFLLQALADVKPYLMVTVPLVMEKIVKNKILPIIGKNPMKSLLKVPILNKFIYGAIRKKLISAFGGNLREIDIGGASITQSVETIMKKIKIPYTIGYGMTECGPLIGYKTWKKFKIKSCGQIVHRMEIRIDSEDPQNIVGEIQVKGDNVTIGYYKNPEATAAAFTDDGWFKTGDLGLIDKDGNIYIKGRIKSMILSANGQNIYPEEIEDKINNLPLIVESVIVDRGKRLVALVYADYDKIKEQAIDIKNLMKEYRDKLNAILPSYSKISKIELQKEAFIKTPKKSIKRFLYC